MKVKQLFWECYRALIFENVNMASEYAYEIIEEGSVYCWELTTKDCEVVSKHVYPFKTIQDAMNDAQAHYEALILSGLETEDETDL